MAAGLLALRFLLEMGLLASMAVVGFSAFEHPLARLVAAVVLVLATAALWGVLLAPRRRVNLPLWIRVTLEFVIFGCAALLLAATGHAPWGLALFVAEILVVSALAMLGHPPRSDLDATGDSARRGG